MTHCPQLLPLKTAGGSSGYTAASSSVEAKTKLCLKLYQQVTFHFGKKSPDVETNREAYKWAECPVVNSAYIKSTIQALTMKDLAQPATY